MENGRIETLRTPPVHWAALPPATTTGQISIMYLILPLMGAPQTQGAKPHNDAPFQLSSRKSQKGVLARVRGGTGAMLAVTGTSFPDS